MLLSLRKEITHCSPIEGTVQTIVWLLTFANAVEPSNMMLFCAKVKLQENRRIVER